MGQRPKSPSLTAKQAPGLRKPTQKLAANYSVLDSHGPVDDEDCTAEIHTFAPTGAGEKNLTRAEVEEATAAATWGMLPAILTAVGQKGLRSGDPRCADVIMRASGFRAHEEDSAINSWESALRPCYRGMEAQLLAGAVDLPALAGEVGP